MIVVGIICFAAGAAMAIIVPKFGQFVADTLAKAGIKAKV